jgi:putative acetyltransferase
MLKIIRTAAENPDFQALVLLLNQELAEIDGDEHDFYHQFNSIENLKYCMVGYSETEPVVCGLIKPFGDDSMEVKRMYTLKGSRGKGLATKLLKELEVWASEMGKTYCLLETGRRQQDAVALYLKNGYQVIPNYGQYIGIENSVCFRKKL